MATIIRPNQEFTTKATVSKGDTQLVSWIIFNGHNSDAGNIFQIQPKIGLELDHSFSQEGKYRIAAYQKEIQTKDDYQSSTELKHVDVTVSYNLLDGSKLLPKNPENFLAGDSLRKGFPAVFEANFLIKPPTAEELSRLLFRLEDGVGNKINEGSAVANVFTFTPQNSNAKYKIIAEYTNEAAVVSKQTFSGTSKALSIKDITHGAQLVRPGTALTFSVTKTQFQFPVGNSTNLPESGEIKWNLDKALIGRGKTITIPGNRLLQKKKYHIEAYVTSALGKTGGDNKDSAHNDWHFEVKENIVEKIKTIKKPKAGLIGDFEIEEMTFKDYDAAKDGTISWKLTGPETGGGSGKTFSKLFKIAGEYTLSCNMGGRQCKEPLKISIVAPIINVDKCKWIDQDNGSGNIITEAGKDQEVCVFVNGDGLDNENLTLNVYDDDTFGKTPVYSITFNTIDAHKTGFYHAFTITDDVITKIKESGVADYGDLYFNIVRNNVDLQIKNGDQKLGEFLKVTLDPKIINAYFCDANDTQQILINALNGALYFKIYATNMVDKKVEINFLTESDAYWTWKDELELDDYKDIKSKFSDERIIDTKSATFNNKGEVLVPVNLSKIGKPKNFIRLNAIVKITEEKKEGAAQKKEQGFYMIHKDLTLLYPPATLPNMAENKGAVIVGREKISGGENNETCVCKEYDLIWGNKVSCAFRKKLIEITKDLWLNDYLEMANNLMAVFKWESGGTFKTDVPNQANSGGTGLIQFMPATAKELLGKEVTIEVVKNYFGKKYNKKTKQKEDWYLKRVKEFAEMTDIEQLGYVKKYFEPLRNKKVEFVDFYLQVLFPVSSRKEDHIVFASSLKKLTTRTSESTKLRNLRVSAYGQNSGLDVDGNGAIWKSEIKTTVQIYLTEGQAYKEDKFECGNTTDGNISGETSKCPEDCSQCLEYADVWDNPLISSDNGGKNNNRYGFNSSRGHKGIDILTGENYKDVHSIMCGEVVSLVSSFKTNEYRTSSLGNTVMIKSKTIDEKIVYVLYCHLDKIYVKTGDKIKHGQKVALSGSTGNASYSKLPNGLKGHGISKANWHCHIEAATKGEGYNNFLYLGSYRVKAEDYMKTKFDKDGNSIK